MMKSTFIAVAASSLLAALFLTGVARAQSPPYTVTDLGTLGGPFSAAFGINSAGRIAGVATDASGLQHAAIWDGGRLIDAGTAGLNSQAGGPNGRDELALFAESPTPDPLGENFCVFFTGLLCTAAIWRKGVTTPLSALGGNNSAAIALNNRGQVVGLAETSVTDKSCKAPQQLRSEAVIWGPGANQIQELPPLPGDTVGFALGINDLGQVVGSSGICANTPLLPMPFGPHAVLWQNGSPIDLKSLGGKVNTAAGVNNRGEVVGGSEVTGETALHTFFWTKDTGMQDLGTVGSDNSSFPGAINNNDQVVGASCDSSLIFCRAYLWQSNTGMQDLNSLVPPDSPLYLLVAFWINDVGEIAGLGVDGSGDVHAFLATPVRGQGAAGGNFSPAGAGPSSPRAIPESVRDLIRRRLGKPGG